MVVDLWASWCPSCRAELPRLDEFANAARVSDILVVGVNVGEKPETAAVFSRALGLKMKLYSDESFRFSDWAGESELPAVLVIDADGKIVHRARVLDRALVEKVLALAHKTSERAAPAVAR
jgi:thiol-disulfide isomerase/thioredoxin